MSSTEKIVLRSVSKPEKENVDSMLDWFCRVFDISNGEGSTEIAILKELLSKSIAGEGVTSMELTEKLSLPRSTVIYHLNRLIQMGIAVRKGRKYYLRSGDMEETISELQADIEREFKRIGEFAQKIDELIEREINGREKRARKR